jgi:hypothetical protein
MNRLFDEEQAIIERQLSMMWFVAASESPQKTFSFPDRKRSSYP